MFLHPNRHESAVISDTTDPEVPTRRIRRHKVANIDQRLQHLRYNLPESRDSSISERKAIFQKQIRALQRQYNEALEGISETSGEGILFRAQVMALRDFALHRTLAPLLFSEPTRHRPARRFLARDTYNLSLNDVEPLYHRLQESGSDSPDSPHLIGALSERWVLASINHASKIVALPAGINEDDRKIDLAVYHAIGDKGYMKPVQVKTRRPTDENECIPEHGCLIVTSDAGINGRRFGAFEACLARREGKPITAAEKDYLKFIHQNIMGQLRQGIAESPGIELPVRQGGRPHDLILPPLESALGSTALQLQNVRDKHISLTK